MTLETETTEEAEPIAAPTESRVPETPGADTRKSIRESLSEALSAAKKADSVQAKPAPKDNSVKADGPTRGPDGKFAAAKPEGQAIGEAPTGAAKVVQPTSAAKPVEVPKSWNPKGRELFAKADPELQAYIVQREGEGEQGVTKLKGEMEVKAKIADAFRQAVQPYEAMLRAEGSNPILAVQSLLNTAYLLRTAPPQQKAQLFGKLAQQFGVDLAAAGTGEAPQVNPEVAELRQRLERQDRQIHALMQIPAQQRTATLQGQISAFEAAKDEGGNPKFPHYAEVRPYMASLLAGGSANTLEQAYEMAVYANPEVRAKVLADKQARDEADKKAREKAESERAARAAVSLKGAPGAARSAAGSTKHKTVRESLAEAMAGRV